MIEHHNLSHAEKRIFLTNRLHENTSMWNLGYCITIHKVVDLDLLEKAIVHVARSHEAMQLRFVEREMEIQQYSDKDYLPTVSRLDFSNAGGMPAWENWADKAALSPLPFMAGVTARFVLATISDQCFGLFMVLHHIIADGTSAALLIEQITDAYECLSGGRILETRSQPGFLSSLEIETNYLNSGMAEADSAYWHQRFEEIPDPIALSTRGQTQGLEIDRLNFSMPASLSDAVYAFCSRVQQSPLRVVMAAFCALVHKFTGQEKMVIGTAGANRSGDDMPKMVGMFAASLPIKVAVESDMRFLELLQQVAASVKGAARHQGHPYDLLMDHLRQKAGKTPDFLDYTIVEFKQPRVPPAYDVAFLCQGQSLEGFTMYLGYQRDNRHPGALAMMVDYRAGMFTHAFIAQLLKNLMVLIEDAVSHPRKRISDIAAMEETEYRKILYHFNSHFAEYPVDMTLHALFETQVVSAPHHVAIVHGDRQLTYGELDARANQLARQLVSHGVKPGAIVGILVEPSPEMIIGLLGILKAGGAYMPIDPTYPIARIRFMLEDAASPLLLSQKHFLSRLSLSGSVLDIDDPKLFTGDAPDISIAGRPDDTACVIYTSGSTGAPKGVMLGHRSMVNFSHWFMQYSQMNAADNVAKHASFSFDASILEIYPALFSGATLHIIPNDIRLALNALNQYYETNDITIGFFTTQLGEQFMELVDNTSLRVLVVGGEKLRTYRPQSYRLVNIYGPTEATVCVTADDVCKQQDNIPIGPPISNCHIYILGKNNQVLPVGMAGELCIGGLPLAKGYLNRPELNAEKFIPNPFLAGERLYRTGDLACWLADGKIAHLGRMDRQVKIRGFRIELGEIELAMLGIPHISEAAVVDKADARGRIFLCAYFVADRVLDPGELRTALREKLPDYMAPQHIAQLENMPLTGSGKIDRLRLPAPQLTQVSSVTFKAPETETQKAIARIWSEVLDDPCIGTGDNFFSLGGHSLKMVAVQLKIEKQLGCRLSLKTLLENPTVGQLADAISDAEIVRPDPIGAAPLMDGYPVTSSQAQLYTLQQMAHIGTTYNVPMCITFTGKLDVDALGRALDTLVDAHEAFRTSFEIVDNVFVQKIHDRIKLNKKFIQAPKTALDGIIADFIKPFNLKKAPLLRSLLVKIDAETHCLLLDVHHIVFDGASCGILISELHKYYQGQAAHPHDIDFKDFAVWYQQRVASDAIKKQEVYWLNAYQDVPVLNLPTDHRRTPAPTFAGACLAFTLERETTAELKGLCDATGATLHVLLLSAFNALLARYTGQDDIVVGTPMAGRFKESCTDMIGMFVNTLPVRSFPRRDKPFTTLVRETRAQMLEIAANQEYPIDKLYRKIDLKREPGRNPLFDVIFVFQNNVSPVWADEELSGAWEILSTGTAKFDLNLAAEEIDGRLNFLMEYRKNLFEPDTIRRMASHFKALVAAVLVNPDQKLKAIPLLSVREEYDLLETYNPPAAQWPRAMTLSHLFERQVDLYPDHVAVVYNGRQLTYRELDRQSNNLAARLRENHVGPNGIVGIFLDRSIEMVVAALAVLKAGGAYLPVIPDYPADRINYIFDDSQANIVITTRALLDRLDFKGLVFDADDPATFSGAGKRLDCIHQPSDMAYIIYTSGSTGKPKGVMVEHRNVVRLLRNDRFYFEFNDQDVWTLFHSFSFDFSVWEMYGALLFGGKLLVVSKEVAQNPAKFHEMLAKEKVTVLNQTPGAFYNLVDEDVKQSGNNLSLRYVIFGGEALKPIMLKPFHEKYPRTKLINMYGITETTVHVTFKAIGRSEIKANISNIGLAIPTLNTYIMDADQKLVPLGVAGELCVGGAGVTRGYLNKETLTATRFIANPYKTDERLYRSGDLARRLPDGEMEYLGRMDFQVQLRGFRVELGEIENELIKHPDVAKVVVLAKEDQRRQQYLCAYYVAGKEIAVKDFRDFLSQNLPDYMIPSYFIAMDAFPLTSNGKVDRDRLPEPGARVATGTVYVAPQTKKQRCIVAIWQDVLGIEKIGIDDDFFALGGHSLKAVALTAKLQNHYKVSVNDIFTYPTVAQLSENIVAIEGNLKHRLLHLKASADQFTKDYTAIHGREIDAYLNRIRSCEQIDLKAEKPYRHILLTGATGYLGIYLLRDLIDAGIPELSVVIRGQSEAGARKRLEDTFDFYFGPDSRNKLQKVRVCLGDLTRPQMGLDDQLYACLAEHVDCIMHAAADVRHFGNYDRFYAVNVGATERLLELASTGKSKDVNHISTISVGVGAISGCSSFLFTEYDLDCGQQSENVYVKTKMEAERKVHLFREKGGRAHIYRIGNIAYDSVSGKFQRNFEANAFFQQVKTYVNLGLAPDLTDERDLSYVDQTSRAILTLYNKSGLKNETFHLENPCKIKLSNFLTDPALGLEIQKAPFQAFMDHLIAHYDQKEFKGYIENILLHMGWMDDSERTVCVSRVDKTVNLLERAGFRWRNTDAHVIEPLVMSALKQRRDHFRQVMVFENLPGDLLDRLAKRARLERIEDQHDLFWEGEVNQSLYLIVDGYAEISRKSLQGWSGTLSIAGPNGFLGEENIVSPRPSSITAEALLGDVTVFKFNAGEFRQFIAEYPTLGLNLISRLSKKISGLQRMVIDMG